MYACLRWSNNDDDDHDIIYSSGDYCQLGFKTILLTIVSTAVRIISSASSTRSRNGLRRSSNWWRWSTSHKASRISASKASRRLLNSTRRSWMDWRKRTTIFWTSVVMRYTILSAVLLSFWHLLIDLFTCWLTGHWFVRLSLGIATRYTAYPVSANNLIKKRSSRSQLKWLFAIGTVLNSGEPNVPIWYRIVVC